MVGEAIRSLVKYTSYFGGICKRDQDKKTFLNARVLVADSPSPVCRPATRRPSFPCHATPTRPADLDSRLDTRPSLALSLSLSHSPPPLPSLSSCSCPSSVGDSGRIDRSFLVEEEDRQTARQTERNGAENGFVTSPSFPPSLPPFPDLYLSSPPPCLPHSTLSFLLPSPISPAVINDYHYRSCRMHRNPKLGHFLKIATGAGFAYLTEKISARNLVGCLHVLIHILEKERRPL